MMQHLNCARLSAFFLLLDRYCSRQYEAGVFFSMHELFVGSLLEFQDIQFTTPLSLLLRGSHEELLGGRIMGS